MYVKCFTMPRDVSRQRRSIMCHIPIHILTYDEARYSTISNLDVDKVVRYPTLIVTLQRYEGAVWDVGNATGMKSD